MRIAHISDLHILALDGAVPFRLFNKRATGYANLKLRRGHRHKSEVVRAIASHLARIRVDHVVITGDVSNLALESEFQAVRRLLDDSLGLAPDQVSIVPGNHDMYTRGAERSQRFYRYFEPYLRSDLPLLRAEHASGRFPVVKLRGPIAFIGLSTAIARPPFFASGRLGSAQLDALQEILSSADLAGATPVILQHHPAANVPAWKWTKRRMEGLDDASRLAEILAPVPRGLLLHGHLHRRVHRLFPTQAGQLDMIGATSASLIDPSPARMAGYNLYEIDGNGTSRIESYRYDEGSGDFIAVPLPDRVEEH